MGLWVSVTEGEMWICSLSVEEFEDLGGEFSYSRIPGILLQAIASPLWPLQYAYALLALILVNLNL